MFITCNKDTSTHIHAHTRTRTHTHTHTHTLSDTHTYTHTHTHAHTLTLTLTHTHTHTLHIHTHTGTHTRTHTCTRTNTRAHIHTHAHTHAHAPPHMLFQTGWPFITRHASTKFAGINIPTFCRVNHPPPLGPHVGAVCVPPRARAARGERHLALNHLRACMPVLLGSASLHFFLPLDFPSPHFLHRWP